MECTIATPEELVFSGSVRSVVVPAVDGEMGFLAKHAPLVGTLGHGELRLDAESGGKQRFYVGGGFVQVLADKVSVLAVEAVPVERLAAAAERERLDRVKASKPAAGAGAAARDEYQRALAAAKARVRLAGR
jgi:F-type H+-transporting ATPase subunit epsilon